MTEETRVSGENQPPSTSQLTKLFHTRIHPKLNIVTYPNKEDNIDEDLETGNVLSLSMWHLEMKSQRVLQKRPLYIMALFKLMLDEFFE